MPELPEVETTLRGIYPHLKDQIISNVTIRQAKLRWPIDPRLQQQSFNAKIIDIQRRAKYLLLQTTKGCIIIHLGMTGRLHVLSEHLPPAKHDHVDIQFKNNLILRYTDPRRFGAILWTTEDPLQHRLIKDLGLEPFDSKFSASYLLKRSQNKSTPIKVFIMDNKVLVGVGNIYASEALYLSSMHPEMPAHCLSQSLATKLIRNIKLVLSNAIKMGGTTLKDFLNAEGKPGYFSNNLQVYGRASKPCFNCKTPIISKQIAQRNTFFCPACQLL